MILPLVPLEYKVIFWISTLESDFIEVAIVDLWPCLGMMLSARDLLCSGPVLHLEHGLTMTFPVPDLDMTACIPSERWQRTVWPC